MTTTTKNKIEGILKLRCIFQDTDHMWHSVTPHGTQPHHSFAEPPTTISANITKKDLIQLYKLKDEEDLVKYLLLPHIPEKARQLFNEQSSITKIEKIKFSNTLIRTKQYKKTGDILLVTAKINRIIAELLA